MVDMTNRKYVDPCDFRRGKDKLGNELKFPCDTQYMVYDPLVQRYHLTEHALIQNGLTFTEFMGDKNLNRFLEKVSKKIDDIIYQFVKNQEVHRVIRYRIATAPKTIYPNQYAMRREFERGVLLAQARFMLEQEDANQISRAYIDRDGKLQLHTIDRNDGSIDVSDIAPEALRTLEKLGMLRWFNVSQFFHLDPSSF